MAITTIYTYPLDGTQKDFNIPFEYLARRFVVLALIGTNRRELTLIADYRFTSKTTVQTNVAWGPAGGYEHIEIRRNTSATDRLVDFADGSILRASEMNLAQVQTLHVAEEARNMVADTIGENNEGMLDARARRLVNLADPIDPGDAVALRQVQEWEQSAVLQRRFLNPKQAHPSVRDNATPLVDGDRYLNTTDSTEYIYKLGAWVANNVDAQDFQNNADPLKGAALIGYKGRTQANKNEEALSITDFGGKGDAGVTNNLSAINAAINAANGRLIRIPMDPSGGQYAITAGTLDIPRAAKFVYEGDARLYAAGGVIVDKGAHLTLLGLGMSGSAVSRTRGIDLVLNDNTGTGSASTLAINKITINDDTLDAAPDFNGTKVDGLLVHHKFGGSGTKGGRHAVEAILSQSGVTEATNPDRNYVGVVGLAETSVGDGGTSGADKGGYFGGNLYGRALSGAMYTMNVTGVEINVAVHAGASTKYRSGAQIVGGGSEVGTVTDAALSVSNLGTSTARWKNGILFGNQNGQPSFNSNSRVISVGAEDVDRVINLESLLSVNYLLYHPKVTLSLSNFVINSTNAGVSLGSTTAANTPYTRYRSGATPAPAYDSQVIASGGNGTDAGGVLGLSASLITFGGTARPSSDNVRDLGSATYRWANVYAGSGAINTSDGRLKQQVRPIDEAALRAWSRVEYCQYKFNDAVATKGDSARWHFGVVAQRVLDAFTAEGLDAFAYGLLCYDEWEAAGEVSDPEGNVIEPAREAGSRYGVRYEEALALECAYLRSRLSA
jgi:hypothetical protein